MKNVLWPVIAFLGFVGLLTLADTPTEPVRFGRRSEDRPRRPGRPRKVVRPEPVKDDDDGDGDGDGGEK